MHRTTARRCCLSLPLAGFRAVSFPDPHTGVFFLEALKGCSLCSARPYRLNSFLPLEARTAWP